MYFLDGTGQMNGMRWVLLVLLSTDSFGNGYPMSYCITSSGESIVAIETFLRTIQRCTNFSPKSIMIDCADAMIGGIKDFDPMVVIVLCFFHVQQAIKKWLQRSDHNVPSEHHEYIHSVC